MQLIPIVYLHPRCVRRIACSWVQGVARIEAVNLHLQGDFDTCYTSMTQDLEIRRMLVSMLIPESAQLHEAAHCLRMG